MLALQLGRDGVNQCEAMVQVREVWTRCGRRPADLHHRLTRARGGLILDKIGEDYHLMYLCRAHHNVAHDEGSAFENGLLIEGYVVSTAQGVQYSGPDPYLKEKYQGG